MRGLLEIQDAKPAGYSSLLLSQEEKNFCESLQKGYLVRTAEGLFYMNMDHPVLVKPVEGSNLGFAFIKESPSLSHAGYAWSVEELLQLGDNQKDLLLEEIASCPFCDGKARLVAKKDRFFGENVFGNKKLGWTLYVKCNKCHSRGKPIKTEAIKLYRDGDFAPIGDFTKTDFHLGKGKGFREANMTFAPYVQKALEAWNHRTPVMRSAAEQSNYEADEQNEKKG